jgi:TolB-like protein/DNA-binding winged helix-turn-helix (wHTH) protein/Tfp pilus assembly protein PilF
MASVVKFGAFELDLQARELRNRGVRMRLRDQSIEILAMLLQRQGEVVTREEIRQRLWPDGTVVEFEHSVNSAVNRLRDALGDSPNKPHFIETLPRRGYRFLSHAETVVKPAPIHEHRLLADVPKPLIPGTARRPFRWAVAPLVLGLFAAAGIASWVLIRRADTPPIRSIAVLPLVNLSHDDEQAYFADGMTEELITELAHIERWKVISRTSVMRYKGSKKSLPEIARDLGVSGIVEGTVSRAGNRVRVTAQLIHAGTDTHLWSGSFDGELRDVLALQRTIAGAIARELRVRATSGTRVPVSRQRPMVPQSYEEYLKGCYFLDRSAYSKAESHFQQAILKDPKFALAHALFAEADGMQTFGRDLPPSAEAISAMETALALDDTLAEAHMIAGDDKFYARWKWEDGEAEFRRAAELDRGSVNAAVHYGTCLHVLGRWDAALAEFTRALELDPVSPRLNVTLLQLLVDTHRYEQAIEQFRKAVELDPNNRAAYSWAGLAYELRGLENEATSAYIKSDTLAGDSAEQIQSLKSAAETGGVRGYWRKRLEILQERAKRDRVPPYDFASLYVRIGENGRAMDMLEAAYQQHAPRLAWIRARAVWQPLRSEPRYQSLLRRMHFPE